MHITVATPYLPYPDVPHGGGQDLFQLIRVLGRRHEVRVVSFTDPHQAAHAEELRSFVTDMHLVWPATTARRKWSSALPSPAVRGRAALHLLPHLGDPVPRAGAEAMPCAVLLRRLPPPLPPLLRSPGGVGGAAADLAQAAASDRDQQGRRGRVPADDPLRVRGAHAAVSVSGRARGAGDLRLAARADPETHHAVLPRVREPPAGLPRRRPRAAQQESVLRHEDPEPGSRSSPTRSSST